MKVSILLPGKIKPKALASAQEDYANRLKSFGVDVVEYKAEKGSSISPEATKQAEANRISKQFRAGDYLIACDERGKSIQTPALVNLLKASRQGGSPMTGRRRLVIVVGGALGLAESIRIKADAVWSLSPLVMAGGVARIVLLEGLYRAFSIIENHPYHNE